MTFNSSAKLSLRLAPGDKYKAEELEETRRVMVVPTVCSGDGDSRNGGWL